MIFVRFFGRLLKFFSLKRDPEGMPGFDREFYIANNPDVAASGTDPLKHYLEYGWREGREPSTGFTGQRYLALNPDVQANGFNPLVHYLKYGLAEGRQGARAEPMPRDPQEVAPVLAPAAHPTDQPREPTRLL